MIILDELKPVLEGLIDGREDAADIIEQISSLDKEVEVDRSEIDKVNKDWNDRFMKAFFGEKATDVDVEIPKIEEVETEEAVDENYDGEDLKYEDLFEEVDEKEEE